MHLVATRASAAPAMAKRKFEQLVGVVHLCMAVDLLDSLEDAALILGSLHLARRQTPEHIGDGITPQSWSLDSFKDQQVKTRLRFTKREIGYLMDALEFPGDEYWVLACGSRFTREEAMTFYPRRLACHNTLLNLANEGFSAQRSVLSQLHQLVDAWLFNNHTSRLLQTGMSKWATRIPNYADHVTDRNGFNLNIFGFVDSTSRPICRPGYWQRRYYSGHKRNHVLQFLSVTAPDGMILYTYGPTDKVHNNNWLLVACGMNDSMLPDFEDLLGDTYAIYGDPIFGQTKYVSRGFPRALASDYEQRTS